MYAFEVFSSLAGVDNRRETLAGLSFTGNLGPREARALVLTICSWKSGARRLEKSAREGLAELELSSSREEEMYSELEDEIGAAQENLERQPPAADGGVCEGSGCPRGEGDVDGEPYLDGFSEPPGPPQQPPHHGHAALFGIGADCAEVSGGSPLDPHAGPRQPEDPESLRGVSCQTRAPQGDAQDPGHARRTAATQGPRRSPREAGGRPVLRRGRRAAGRGARPHPVGSRDCYFQLNYSRERRIAGARGRRREGLSIEAMTDWNAPRRSEDARGYEEPRLAASSGLAAGRPGGAAEVSVDGPPWRTPPWEPLYARSWLGGETRGRPRP
ncbi:hypothetical protein Q5P01_000673 [Channa striata]|uniref:Uncharacterized protein n=1 Tax=Channa striata TaxID=64152 RepID=A0AA88LIW8_CHASR|nr:hypothetical protein Q5P01_000673 [Channa striata]